MAIEARRSCGYRKVGGIYLVGTGEGIACDRLPYELTLCPCCGAGIKQARGITWLKARQFFVRTHSLELEAENSKKDCICLGACPVCNPTDEKYGLLWIGEKYYTAQSFVEEARRMGISKRVAQVPKGIKLGETWLLLAHPKVIAKPDPEKKELFKYYPAIFYAFRPQRIEKIITDKQATPKMMEQLKKRGLTPVVVPENDPDHNPGNKKHKEGDDVVK